MQLGDKEVFELVCTGIIKRETGIFYRFRHKDEPDGTPNYIEVHGIFLSKGEDDGKMF